VRATLASICPPRAERAKALRAAQCRERWHLEDEPDDKRYRPSMFLTLTCDSYGKINNACTAIWSTATCGRLPGRGGHLGDIYALGNTDRKCRRTGGQIKEPGNRQLSNGAAYRNRTDDLRITSASL
jgi:hypothetical protein